jgi:ABC-type cobalt transport system substrate-binding protein
MNDKNKVILVVVIFVVSIMVFSIGGNFLVDRIADRVIQKIRQEYSPSRYGPGIDPDKVEIDRNKLEKKYPWKQ